MAKIVIATTNEYDLPIGADDQAVTSLVERLERELPDFELVFNRARVRELLPSHSFLAAGTPFPELVVEIILPTATATTVTALVNIAVSWLRNLARTDRGREKTIDIAGPNGALLATVRTSPFLRRAIVRSFLPEDVQRRRRHRRYAAFAGLATLVSVGALLWNADLGWVTRIVAFIAASMIFVVFAYNMLFDEE